MLRIYNTLTGEKDNFEPITGKKVNVFVCGPTVYDFSHLGHAKTYTQFDFIVRYLKYSGYEVTYLQNITDIDDRIITRSRESNVNWKELAEKFETIYREDMESLGNTSVDRYARATDHIDQIIEQVNTLLEKGVAYKAEDGIYYEVATFPEYGKLSKRTTLREEDSVSRIDASSCKRGWNDFCLWKARKEGEPYWDSVLGPGRPGWHIEDTAITETFFGPQYDIHGGAIDLIFPHHECEIAQMEAASGKEPLVRYWMHTGFLNINSEKMSKSKGNFKTIRETLKEIDFRIIRYYLLSSHYRATVDLGMEGIEHARNSLNRVREFLFDVDVNHDDHELEPEIAKVRGQIKEALDNDFNTPECFAHIFTFIKDLNRSGNKKGKRVRKLFTDLNFIFGDIFQLDSDTAMNSEEIEKLIEERENYRQAKDYAQADQIRDQLLEKGIQIYDSPEGVRWRAV